MADGLLPNMEVRMDTLVCSSSSDGAHHQYCERIVLYSLAFQRTYIFVQLYQGGVCHSLPLATIVIVLYMKNKTQV